MPKLKTKKILSKKVKVTKTGKVMRTHQLKNGHLKRNKSKSALRRYQIPVRVSKAFERSYKRLLGKA